MTGRPTAVDLNDPRTRRIVQAAMRMRRRPDDVASLERATVLDETAETQPWIPRDVFTNDRRGGHDTVHR